MRAEDAHVLVIEDDPMNLMVIVDMLKLTGVKHVQTGASGEQGLQRAADMPQVDLILLDIQLPGEDGYGVLRHIRGDDKLKEARVLAVTANVLPQDELRAREAGFDGFIGKPLNFMRFPGLIRAALSGERVWSLY